MHFDLPAVTPLYKIDGLQIRGAKKAGRKERGDTERSWRTWTRKSSCVIGGLKSFVKNLLFFVELWFRQLFSDSCLYILEFLLFHRTYLCTVTSFRILFLFVCCLSTRNILYIYNGWRLTVVSGTILVQCREKKYQIILLYNSRV